MRVFDRALVNSLTGVSTAVATLGSLFAALSCVPARAAEPSPAPLPAAAEENLLKSATGEGVFSSAPFGAGPASPGDDQSSKLWIGTKATLFASIVPTIHFTEDGKGRAVQHPFTMRVVLGETKASIVSNLFGGKHAPGVDLRARKTAERYFVRGVHGRSLLILQPPAESPAAANAILLCVGSRPDPKLYRVDGWYNPSLPEAELLVPVPTGLTLYPDAAAEGRFLSGVRRGLAEVSLRVGPGMGPPEPAFDRLLGKDPRVSLRYESTEKPKLLPFSGTGEAVGEVEAAAVYHNAAGHRRREAVVERLWVKRRPYDERIKAVAAKMANGPNSGDAFNCFSVVRARSRWISYSREPLPEEGE